MRRMHVLCWKQRFRGVVNIGAWFLIALCVLRITGINYNEATPQKEENARPIPDVIDKREEAHSTSFLRKKDSTEMATKPVEDSLTFGREIKPKKTDNTMVTRHESEVERQKNWTSANAHFASDPERPKEIKNFANTSTGLVGVAERYCKSAVDLTGDRTELQKVFYSNHYKISFCSAAFVATTLSSLVITVLEFGVRSVKDSYEARPVINWRLLSQFDLDFKGPSRNIVFVRNPYDRLFSMYVKLSYSAIPNTLNKSIKKHLKLSDSECTEVSFQNFLDYVLAKRNVTVWKPIHSTCNPCHTKPRFIVKQENLTSDVKYILREIKATKEEYDEITEILGNYRFSAIPFLVKELVGKKFSQCFTWMDAAGRAWQALKMLGYLHKSVVFPKQKIMAENKENDILFLAELAKKRIKQSPHEIGEMETQRHNALVEAYSSIKPQTLLSVQEAYHHDFGLFNYSTEVPR